MAFVEVKQKLMSEVEALGFPRARVVRALHSTGEDDWLTLIAWEYQCIITLWFVLWQNILVFRTDDPKWNVPPFKTLFFYHLLMSYQREMAKTGHCACWLGSCSLVPLASLGFGFRLITLSIFSHSPSCEFSDSLISFLLLLWVWIFCSSTSWSLILALALYSIVAGTPYTQ